MGGVLILGSVFISTILWARLDSLYLWLALGATTSFGIIGFVDDYIKIVKKRSLGLTGKQKLLGQLITAIVVWGCLYWFCKLSLEFEHSVFQGNGDHECHDVGAVCLFVFIIFVLLGSSNAVNLTDGMDGLATSMTFIAMSALTALTYVSSDGRWSEISDYHAQTRSRRIDGFLRRDGRRESSVFCGITRRPRRFLWAMSGVWQSAARSERWRF